MTCSAGPRCTVGQALRRGVTVTLEDGRTSARLTLLLTVGMVPTPAARLEEAGSRWTAGGFIPFVPGFRGRRRLALLGQATAPS